MHGSKLTDPQSKKTKKITRRGKNHKQAGQPRLISGRPALSGKTEHGVFALGFCVSFCTGSRAHSLLFADFFVFFV